MLTPTSHSKTIDGEYLNLDMHQTQPTFLRTRGYEKSTWTQI